MIPVHTQTLSVRDESLLIAKTKEVEDNSAAEKNTDQTG